METRFCEGQSSKGNNSKNIAKSEQSSHTPGGSHHRRLRPYHINFLERKKNSTNKETDKQY